MPFLLRSRTIMAILSLALLAACDGQATRTPQATDAAVPAVTPTVVTAAVARATETPPATSDSATATLAVVAGEEAATATPTLSPVRATQQALADSVRVPTRVATSLPIAPDDYVALVDQACRIVQENYVRDDYNGVDWRSTCEVYRAEAASIETQEAYWELMSAFIAELGDDHSRYVPPGRFTAEFNLPSEGSGRPWPGFILSAAREHGPLLVWNVCQNGPAAQAGLVRGDAILAIDGEPVSPDRENFDANALLYADGKVQVNLTVQQGPEAEPHEVTVHYGGASGCDGWQYDLLSEAPRIGYIRIPDFSGNASANLLEALRLLEEQAPLDGLVLDVRHNPGGNADQSIAIFTEGTFGFTGPLRDDASQSVYRIRGPVRWNQTTPVALLIDGASHSAAEYFATAMQQSGRATLVGMPTAGNTEGITGFNLADGSLIRLATTTLQLQDGSTLEDVGVQPDVRVPLGAWGLRQRPDVQLQTALEQLRAP